MPVVDLSHPIRDGMAAYPGVPAPRFGAIRTHSDVGTYASGTTFQLGTYALGGNTGTYVDAPFHRFPAGADLASLPLECLVNLPGVVIDASPEGATATDSLGARSFAGHAVLFRTGWSRHWETEGYFRSGPFLTRATCEALVRAHVALVGIDCANIDDTRDLERPAHTVLLGAGIPIVEHLRGLELLPSSGFRFTAAPPALVGGTSFPVRAFAVLAAEG
ncbi:MAG: cyclase family protein [Myxococcaceae bacterium]